MVVVLVSSPLIRIGGFSGIDALNGGYCQV